LKYLPNVTSVDQKTGTEETKQEVRACEDFVTGATDCPGIPALSDSLGGLEFPCRPFTPGMTIQSNVLAQLVFDAMPLRQPDHFAARLSGEETLLGTA
jgi:hypothetical protein